MNKLLILFTIISYSSFACNPVLFIEKDKPAPCTGYLFTPEKEKEIRLKVVENDFLKDLNTIQTRQIGLYKAELDLTTQQANLWRDQSQKLSERLIEHSNRDFWHSFAWFALGAATTILITYGVNQK